MTLWVGDPKGASGGSGEEEVGLRPRSAPMGEEGVGSGEDAVRVAGGRTAAEAATVRCEEAHNRRPVLLLDPATKFLLPDPG